jgi:hypothetical protein
MIEPVCLVVNYFALDVKYVLFFSDFLVSDIVNSLNPHKNLF